MQLQLVTRKAWTGVDASVPSIAECETWAATEEEALTLLLDRVAYFLRLRAGFKHSIDILRKEDGDTYYTLTLP
jgi:hypothetical protein